MNKQLKILVDQSTIKVAEEGENAELKHLMLFGFGGMIEAIESQSHKSPFSFKTLWAPVVLVGGAFAAFILRFFGST